MASQKYTDAQLEKMSMIDLAGKILGEHKKELSFKDLFNEVAELKKFTEDQKRDLLARFYTDLNIDGRFMTVGSNVWGLKRWYPVDQTTEKSLAESRKRDQEEALEEEYIDEDETEDDEQEYENYDELDFDKIEED